jgi:hypothetical protein
MARLLFVLCLSPACAPPPRMPQSDVIIDQDAVASSEDVAKSLAGVKRGAKLRILLQGDTGHEIRSGKYSRTNSQRLFLDAPPDSMDLGRVNEVWMEDPAPTGIVLAGTIVGAVVGGMMFKRDSYTEDYWGLGAFMGGAAGALAMYPVSFSQSGWEQMFPPRSASR